MIRNVVTIGETQRGLLLRDGRLVRVLDPGRHVIWDWDHRRRVEVHSATGHFASPWGELLEKRYPEIAPRYLTTVRPGPNEVGVVRLDGKPSYIVGPNAPAHIWNVLQTVDVTFYDIVAAPRLPRAEFNQIEGATPLGVTTPLVSVSTAEGSVSLVFFDGQLVETLPPGREGYWQIVRRITQRTVDVRPTPLEITAQEILTRDRISLRVTLTAFLQATDPVKAALSVPDYSQHVYKLVQFAVREAVGGRTLDEVLNDRATVDRQIAEHVRQEVNDLGVQVTELGIKDVILPGEMRELINKVVEAEKVAQANLIRRREETAATRSLLNTAKLIEDNPTLMRLKELESLERITEKIGRIDVQASSGQGLNAVLDQLVHLRKRED